LSYKPSIYFTKLKEAFLISKGFINKKEIENTFEISNPKENNLNLNKEHNLIGEIDDGINYSLDLIIQECNDAKKEYLTMVEDIHAIISNREDLSNYEKINYCNSERHYMKQYLKHVMIKINSIFPD